MTLLVFPSKTAGEVVALTFPFRDLLAFGESITGSSVTADVFSGTDANPSTLISGLPTNSAIDVAQVIAGGVPGVIYELTCTVTTSDSNVLTKTGKLAVITPGGKFGA